MSGQVEQAKRLPEVLAERRWDGGVRIVVQGAMRLVMRDGSADLDPSWRADVFFAGKQRKPSFVFIAETPQQLFADLAALSEGVEP